MENNTFLQCEYTGTAKRLLVTVLPIERIYSGDDFNDQTLSALHLLKGTLIDLCVI